MYVCGNPDGPLLVCFHGLGHWARGSWSPLAARLAADYRLIAFDLPGFGASDKPDAPYDLDFFTSVCGRAFARVAPHGATLVGHSLGGLIAAGIAAEYPALAHHLILISPAGFKAARPWVIAFLGNRLTAPMFNLQPSRWVVRRALSRAVFRPRGIAAQEFEQTYAALGDPGVRRAFARVYAAATHELRDFTRIRELVKHYRGPVLAVIGRHDPYIPPGVAAPLAAAYPAARIEVIERCGHIAQIEDPAQVATLVRETVPPAGRRGT